MNQQLHSVNLESQGISRIPSTASEADIVTFLQSTPGVKHKRKLFGNKKDKG